MALQRLLLLALAVCCLWDLEKTWRVARLHPEPLRVLLSTNGSHELEGYVRYLHWEIAVRNRQIAEIALDIDDRSGECAILARHLERDGLVVKEPSGEPALVLRLRVSGAAAR